MKTDKSQRRARTCLLCGDSSSMDEKEFKLHIIAKHEKFYRPKKKPEKEFKRIEI